MDFVQIPGYEFFYDEDDGKRILKLRKLDLDAGPISIDFESLWRYHQRQNYALSKEPLAKALGLKGGQHPYIFDATCGMGKDSLLMLFFGCKLWAFERVFGIASLLDDAIQRAQHSPLVGDVFKERFGLSVGSATELMPLKAKELRPDVVYIDPMYPEQKKKSALPNKQMRIFRDLVGHDEDADKLFHVALECAKERVVVKRPLHAPLISDNVTASYKGKAVRYDMYRIHS